ncbi:unnamed protein product [Mucor hiemalis]
MFNSSVDSTRFSPTLNSGVEANQKQRSRITPSSLDYILSPSEDSKRERQYQQQQQVQGSPNCQNQMNWCSTNVPSYVKVFGN